MWGIAQAMLEADRRPSPDGSIFRCIPYPYSTYNSNQLVLDDLDPKQVV